MGYPVLLKAVGGGGGKGMRIVARDADFASAWRDASSEAMNAFGDPRLYLEKYLEKPRHIEIQILADTHGRVVSLGERECSVQRRYQKVIEEAPSPIMTPGLRKKMSDAAVLLARAGGYINAGTVEFLVSAQTNFYFLEVTTRLLREPVEQSAVPGIKTTDGLFRRILAEPDFLRAEIHTRWLDELLPRPPSAASNLTAHFKEEEQRSSAADAAVIAAALWHALQWDRQSCLSSSGTGSGQSSRWKLERHRDLLARTPLPFKSPSSQTLASSTPTAYPII